MRQKFCNICILAGFLNKLKGIELMPSPVESIDLALSDYYLFQFMAYFLHSEHFNNQEQVEDSVKEFFALKDKN